MGWFFLQHALKPCNFTAVYCGCQELAWSENVLTKTLDWFLKSKLTGFRSVGFRAAKCQKPVGCSGALSLYPCPHSCTPPKAQQRWVTWPYINLSSDPVLLISCFVHKLWEEWVKNHWVHLKLTFLYSLGYCEQELRISPTIAWGTILLYISFNSFSKYAIDKSEATSIFFQVR